MIKSLSVHRIHSSASKPVLTYCTKTSQSNQTINSHPPANEKNVTVWTFHWLHLFADYTCQYSAEDQCTLLPAELKEHEISVNICPVSESAESQLVSEWTDSTLRRPDVSWHDSAQESLVMYLCISYSCEFSWWYILKEDFYSFTLQNIKVVDHS